MEHNYLTFEETTLKSSVIYQRDNNIDKLDNLDELPDQAAVYAMCGRVNGQPANPRYIGHSGDLRSTVKNLFDKNQPAPEQNDCFKQFMLSIKTKEIVYELMSQSSEEDRIVKTNEWIKRFNPECNEVLNKIH